MSKHRLTSLTPTALIALLLVGCAKSDVKSESEKTNAKGTAGSKTSGRQITVQAAAARIDKWMACDLIVGPKGDSLQLFFSAIARTAPPTDNLPYLYYEQLSKDPRVKTAVPLLLGDSTKKGDFPVVGTTGAYFKLPVSRRKKPGASPRSFAIRWQKGRSSFTKPFDAVIGSEVAAKNGWSVGEKIRVIHGSRRMGFEPHIHDETFTVVGVLNKTGTPNDRTVFVPAEGFYAVAGHAKTEGVMRTRLEGFFGRKYSAEEWKALRGKPKSLREVTAILIVAVRPPDDLSGIDSPVAFDLKIEINRGYGAQAIASQDIAESMVRHLRTIKQFLKSAD